MHARSGNRHPIWRRTATVAVVAVAAAIGALPARAAERTPGEVTTIQANGIADAAGWQHQPPVRTPVKGWFIVRRNNNWQGQDRSVNIDQAFTTENARRSSLQAIANPGSYATDVRSSMSGWGVRSWPAFDTSCEAFTSAGRTGRVCVASYTAITDCDAFSGGCVRSVQGLSALAVFKNGLADVGVSSYDVGGGVFPPLPATSDAVKRAARVAAINASKWQAGPVRLTVRRPSASARRISGTCGPSCIVRVQITVAGKRRVYTTRANAKGVWTRTVPTLIAGQAVRVEATLPGYGPRVINVRVR